MISEIASAAKEVGQALVEITNKVDISKRIDVSSVDINKSNNKVDITKRIDLSSRNNVDLKDGVDKKEFNKLEIDGPIKNKLDGLARENKVANELEIKYPESEGYKTISEAYLRDKDGKIVQDPAGNHEARRVDFVVVKDDKVVDSVEVTSKTASKDAQVAKENRIREAGGNFVRDDNGKLIEMPSTLQTRIERRE